jgi:transposase InsO family protein
MMGEIAQHRLDLIIPLLQVEVGTQELRLMTQQIAKQAGLSVKTIMRYIQQFRKNGFDGLKPQTTGRPAKKVIPPHIIEIVIQMKLENPKRSPTNIIMTLESTGQVEVGTIKRSTLNDALKKRCVTRASLKLANEPKVATGNRFQKQSRNELWQSDFKHGPYICNKKTYLITYIDDCTRYVLFSKFYNSESFLSVNQSLRKAIEDFGTPKSLYFDNGAPFKAKALNRTVTLLEIKKIHTKPRRACSKGKIEKFHQVVDKFISELRLEKVASLEEMNNKWADYLDFFYQGKEHSALPKGVTPFDAFFKDKTKFRLVSRELLDNAFLGVVYGRSVDKCGCVNFRNTKYTADGLGLFVGRRVDIIFSLTDELQVWIEPELGLKFEAHELKQGSWVSKKTESTLKFNNPDSKPTHSKLLVAAKIQAENKKNTRLKLFSGQIINPPSNSSSEDSHSDMSLSATPQLLTPANLDGCSTIDNTGSLPDNKEHLLIKLSELKLSQDRSITSPNNIDNGPKRNVISFKAIRNNQGDK